MYEQGFAEHLKALKEEVQRNHQQNIAELHDLQAFVTQKLAELYGSVEQLIERVENPAFLAERVAAKLIEFAEQLPDEPEEAEHVS